MATKSTSKKPAPKASAAKKAPATRRQPSKTHKSKKALGVSSFRASSDATPFLTLAITRQTLYWGILSFIVLIMGLWIIHLQNEINKIYDAIEASQMQIDESSYVIKKRS